MATKKQVEARRVVAYVRVSTDKQATEGNSLEAQQARLAQYAGAFGLEIVATEVDAGASAGSLEREGLQRALRRLELGEADGLLVVKLDRLTRSVRDLCELVEVYFKEWFALLSVGEQIDTRSAAGRMLLNMLTVIGQWEREAIAERTSAVLQYMKAQGAFTGGFPPYGFRVSESGACLEEVPEEQEIIRRARAFREQGMSLRSIAAALPPNRQGKPFDPKQIARML